MFIAINGLCLHDFFSTVVQFVIGSRKCSHNRSFARLDFAKAINKSERFTFSRLGWFYHNPVGLTPGPNPMGLWRVCLSSVCILSPRPNKANKWGIKSIWFEFSACKGNQQGQNVVCLSVHHLKLILQLKAREMGPDPTQVYF